MADDWENWAEPEKVESKPVVAASKTAESLQKSKESDLNNAMDLFGDAPLKPVEEKKTN